MILLFVLQSLPSPYSVVRPGGADQLAPLLQLPSGYRMDTGWLARTSIRVRKASYGDWLTARADRTARLVPSAETRPAGVSDSDHYAIGSRSIEEAKTVAAVVALRRAGYPAEAGRRGVLVGRVDAAAPAGAKLEVGDVILSLDGAPVTSKTELRSRIQRRRIGDELRLEVERERQQLPVDLTLIESAAEPGRPIIGIRASDYLLDAKLPFPVEIDTRNRVGPSGGLMYSLALLDALTAGDLAGGQRIAGTGTMALDGRVGPIGGVREKVIAAEREQAEVFLAPRENGHAATRAATRTRVIAVGTFEEAVTALLALGGQLAT